MTATFPHIADDAVRTDPEVRAAFAKVNELIEGINTDLGSWAYFVGSKHFHGEERLEAAQKKMRKLKPAMKKFHKTVLDAMVRHRSLGADRWNRELEARGDLTTVALENHHEWRWVAGEL